VRKQRRAVVVVIVVGYTLSRRGVLVARELVAR